MYIRNYEILNSKIILDKNMYVTKTKVFFKSYQILLDDLGVDLF